MPVWRTLIPLLVVGLLAGCDLSESDDPPFVLEDVNVERIDAATPDAMSDMIGAQVGGPTLVVSIGAADSAEDVRAEWSRLVAQSVYRDQAPAAGLPPFNGLGGGGEPVSVYRTASEDAFRGIVEQNVDALGLELVSLEFIHPEGIAVPVAVVRAPDEFLERSGGAYLGYSIFNGANDETRSLGWYADVVDEDGEWVQSQGLVPTAGSGEYGVAERWWDHDECGGPVLCTVHG